MEARVCVITGYGTNSQIETARAAILAGAASADLAHFSQILSGERRIDDYNFLVFPGGFLDGDDLGAAQAAAVRWRFLKDREGVALLDHLREFLSRRGLILGICNGFQLLLKLGLLPALDNLYFERQASLDRNDSGKFEDRWVRLKVNPLSPCVFTTNLESLYLPIRHGEGKFIAPPSTMKRIVQENLDALRYADSEGNAALRYPDNPNGSLLGVAGLTDPSGHVLGLMPHPEAFHHATNHPGWTRGEMDPPGTLLFVNAVRYLNKLS